MVQQQQQRPSSLLGRPTSHRPSATTLKLTHLLDEKKKPRKQKQHQQRTRTSPPRSGNGSNALLAAATTSTDIFGTARGLTLAELDAARKKKQPNQKTVGKVAVPKAAPSANCIGPRQSTQQRSKQPRARVSIRPPPTISQNEPQKKKRRINTVVIQSPHTAVQTPNRDPNASKRPRLLHDEPHASSTQLDSHDAHATVRSESTAVPSQVVEGANTPGNWPSSDEHLGENPTRATNGAGPTTIEAPTQYNNSIYSSASPEEPEAVPTTQESTSKVKNTPSSSYGTRNDAVLVSEATAPAATTTTLPFSKRTRLVERHAKANFASDTTDVTAGNSVEPTTARNSSTPEANLSTQPNASTAHFPRLIAKEAAAKKQQKPKANYVRLNMKNAAGACRFHRKPRNKKEYNKRQQYERTTAPLPAATTIDPVDDYLDGVYTQQPKKKQQRNSSIPLCSGHHQPCIRRVVKKAGPNKGRAFFVCPCRPRSEQCRHFAWADDGPAAARAVLLQNTSVSGFLARHVEAYRQRMALHTVPELRLLAERHGLDDKGNKAALRTRLAVWVRDELVAGLDNDEAAPAVAEEEGSDMSDEEGELGAEGEDMSDEEGELEAIQRENLDEESSVERSADDDDDEGEMVAATLTKVGALGGTLLQNESQFVNCSNETSEQAPMIHPLGNGDKFVEFADDSSDEDSDGEDSPVDTATTKKNTMSKLVTTPSCEDAAEETTLKSILHDRFGFNEFRQGQEWAVKRCLAKQRSLLVAPTGSGKSLCYALPASMMKGVCIVVSPLLSLIDDQIRHLPVRLASTTLSGPMTAASTAATVDDVVRGRIRILFVSPERLTSASFRRLFRPRWNNDTKTYEKTFPPVSMLCVDEAHTLSQWAHNFRPSYLRLQSIIKLIEPQSVLALTATAGPRVVDDICQSLDIPRGDPEEDGGVVTLPTNRDNIDVKCVFLESQEERLDKLIKVLSKPAKPSKENPPKKDEHDGKLWKGSVIVYVWRQRDAEIVAENIGGSEISGGVVVYHGGMDSAQRKRSQSKFMRGKARICVATVAFGLGINKPDVAGVIHLYLSSSPEHYIQEIGRAGRDGRPSRALALVLRDEIYVRHSLANSDRIALSQVESLISVMNERLQAAIRVLPPSRSKTLPICICFPLAASETRCGFKPETAETFLSMMEQRGNQLPLLTIEGVSYDAATISPIKCRLEELSEKEPVVKALMLCCTCVDPPLGESRSSQLDSERSSAGGHSFGSYSFSVSECCNCLGESAEPRHVFAALRRLQQFGAVDFVLQSSPRDRVLSLQLSVSGMESFRRENFSRELAREVYDRFHTTVSSGERKVAELHSILSHVSMTGETKVDSKTPPNSKSQSLVVFQQKVNVYFESETNNTEDTVLETPTNSPFETKINRIELARDAQTALTYIADVQSSSSDASVGGATLKVGDPSIPDYTALVVTKFLHGLAPHNMAYSLLRHHPMFGRYQRAEFSTVLKYVRLVFRVEQERS